MINRRTRGATRANIVISPLTIIAEDFICFRNSFESQSSRVPDGLGRLRMLIRVKFLRQLPECLLDFFLRGASAQAQNLVVIASIHGGRHNGGGGDCFFTRAWNREASMESNRSSRFREEIRVRGEKEAWRISDLVAPPWPLLLPFFQEIQEGTVLGRPIRSKCSPF